jgi:adenylate kinase
MASAAFSTAHLDYLQRISAPAPLSGDAPKTSALPNLRRLWRVRGTGRLEKAIEKQLGLHKPEQQMQLVSKDVLMAMYGHKYNLAFLVKGTPEEVAIHIGTWSPSSSGSRSAQEMNLRQQVLKTALNSIYPAIELADVGVELGPFPLSGFVLGIPTAKPVDPPDGTLPLDRLIRALTDATWASLVLAQPVEESEISFLRNSVISEIRGAEAAAGVERAPSPLAKYYSDLLTKALKSLSSGAEVGLWRTGVYLLGDEESYRRLAGVWRGIFSGDDSLPEPVRVWDGNGLQVAKLAAEWALPDVEGLRGPGQSQYRHPLQYQTLLTSGQLAAYIHLPQLETIGFAISRVTDFDTVQQAHRTTAASIQVGSIVVRGQPTKMSYEVDLDALTKHVFVAGVTGAGKTTSIFHLLRQAWAAKIPFLVIEPAKTEYRELRNYPEFGEALRVFTLGDENCSPMRLNPFELIHEDTPLSLHIDLLRSVFTHSFGLWNPLPQILEECLYLIYQDKGWDIASSFNRRTEDRRDPSVFPTLSDLTDKISEVTQRLQWDAEAKGRIQGALRDKLRGLRHGGRGRLLDTQRSVPMTELMENPTVLELERLGDDDDKAFLMGLLLIRLWEYRRAQAGPSSGKNSLQHLFVLEEAHRLLTNVSPTQQQGETDAKAKAVESFTNLLSEIRAYGEGVIVTDQVPVKLAPDVIKNTNLKIAHRIVDAEDRKVLAGSMALTDQQAVALAILEQGRAAVFREGEDGPLLVEVPAPPSKAKAQEKPVKQHMAHFRQKYKELLLRHPGCKDTAEHGGASCDAARALVETSAFRQNLNRLFLSVIADDSASDRLWGPIDQSLNSFLTKQVDRDVMLQCTLARAAGFYSSKRGTQSQWSYQDTNEFAKLLEAFLSDLANRVPTKGSLDRLRQCYFRLNVMAVPYYSRCQKICDSQPLRCLYRQAVSDVVEAGDFTVIWNASDPFNPASAAATSLVCTRVANTLVENHPNQAVSFRRIGLCYGQMMLAANAAVVLPENRDQLVDLLCEQPGYKLAEPS